MKKNIKEYSSRETGFAESHSALCPDCMRSQPILIEHQICLICIEVTATSAFYVFMAGGGIEPPRCRAYEARKPQPVLQPAIILY